MRAIDTNVMRELRRQGMSNKQIAEKMKVSISTVYRCIGRKSQAQKYAEVQRKADVVPLAALRPSMGALAEPEGVIEVVPVTEWPAPEAVVSLPPSLKVVSARYRLQGAFCTYGIDTAAGDIEVAGDILNGMLDRDTLDDLISELMEVRDMLNRGGV